MKSARRQRNHDLVIEEILTTARAIMREEGPAALSMQELARRLDMRAPSLYNYFAGKTEIYDTLFRRGFVLFDAYIQEQLAGAQDWQDELHRYLAAYMAFALEQPDLYQLCFERPVPGFMPSQASLDLGFAMLERAYATARRWSSTIHSDLDPQQMTDLVIAVMHGLTALHMANEPHLPVGQGRFGGLIPAAVSLFEKAWTQPVQPEGDRR